MGDGGYKMFDWGVYIFCTQGGVSIYAWKNMTEKAFWWCIDQCVAGDFPASSSSPGQFFIYLQVSSPGQFFIYLQVVLVSFLFIFK